MGYKNKNDTKGERELGYDAVRKMVNTVGYDPQTTLALAQSNIDSFRKLDDLDSATFVGCMKDLRENHPDIYPVFWWWRFAEEDAGYGKEDDCDTGESRYRCFMITQFLAAPFSDEWEDDRLALKQGVTPWITEQQIVDGLNHKSIKRWFWVWHDRDIYTEKDEITDRRGLVKAGDKKFKHAHVMVDIPAKVSIDTVARWFKVPANMIDIFKGHGAFLDGVEYLVHETPSAVAEGKTHYEDDEVFASPGFDFRKELTDLQSHRAKFGRRAGEMTPADTMRMHVMLDGWTMKQCRDDDPLTYSKIRNSLPPLRLDYLLDSPPCPFRMNIYVDGDSGLGKSSFCRFIAETLFPNYERAYFPIGNDDRVTFDGYDGEPVIIWNDMRASDFVARFKPSGTYKILDTHPDNEAQQAKGSRVILCNAVNIINGVQPYEEFINGLAGTYVDKNGKRHEAEDDTQAWRRFPMILCVHENDFDILFNSGFVNNDLSSVKTMVMYGRVRASMSKTMQLLDGAAKAQVLLPVGEKVSQAYHEIESRHADKISDPNLIPDEFKHFGELISPEDVKREVHDKFLDEMVREEEACFNELVGFAHWFWDEFVSHLNREKFYKYLDADDKTAYQKGFLDDMAFSDIERAIRNYGSENMILRYNEKVIRGALELVWLGDL